MDGVIRSALRLIALASLIGFLSPWQMTWAAGTEDPGPNGELIYVPIYSSIFYQDNKRTLELAAMLSIHNVDTEHSLTITKVDYYNTKGEPIRKYLEEPLHLKPLETKNVVIEKADASGGTGANFLVEWRAKKEGINSPLVEALMVSVSSSQNLSFTSTGRVVKRFGVAEK